MISEVIYTGNLRTEATHLKSNQKIITDAPTDNNGKGEAFSPTDLCATSLASCILTIMGIAAHAHQININGTRAQVYKFMASNPRRIEGISIDIYMPNKPFDEKQKKILEKAAHNCPVALSLSPKTEEKITIHW